MRIQHNIMAMAAYRNYNTNTSALAKNLEKLSSGYKINRAGDDAAGLAISEKMRAQITGLEAAQKNVKDGISLVKTAEGAMQEIQDMLNRMDYLATQSANGTYQDEVDRENLNKEMSALKTEIDRIAESANFNGINLLDGSRDPKAVKGGTDAVEASTNGFDIPDEGSVLGTDTIVHKENSNGTTGSVFSVDLADTKFNNGEGESMSIKIGDDLEIKIEGDSTGSGTELDADGIIGLLTGSTTPTNNAVTGVTYGTDNTVTIKGQDFKIEDGGDGTLKFTQVSAPTQESEEVDPNMDVKIEGSGVAATKEGWKTGAYTAGVGGTTTFNDDAKVDVAVTVADSTGGGGNDENLTFSVTGLANDATADDVVTALKAATATNANADTIKLGDIYDISADASGAITFALKDDQTAADSPVITGVTYTADTTTGIDSSESKGTLAAGTGATTASPAGGDPVTGDYNVKTIVQTSVETGANRLASTVITLTEDMIADGASVIIGNEEYTFSADAADKPDSTGASPDGKVYIGDMVGEGKSIDMDEVVRRLTKATAENEIWTVGFGSKSGEVSLMEKTDENGASAVDPDDADLTTVEGIAATLGYTTVAKEAVAGTAGKGLNLQIGDTSDPFNQMEVEIGDMHVTAMGTFDEDGNLTKSINDIDILTSENAQEAVDVIKNAINYVSSVRGDLGAYQNRLEHTANNLSVMAENIQDAESTIRDTDIAEEMMSYTKNNILVQSAQAMLAQANAVPQGVLQLLG